MADQTVKVENDNDPRVALDLMRIIQSYEPDNYQTKDKILALYKECRTLTSAFPSGYLNDLP